MKAGATDYLVKPFEEDELDLAITKSLEKRKLLSEISSLRKQAAGCGRAQGGVHLHSPKMQKVKETRWTRWPRRTVSVLIEGESGTGKELVARALHYKSRLRTSPSSR
jgi:DNA-binding NtrC family response regulator